MIACALCGIAPTDDGELLSWSRDGDRWICPACTREHVRAIEAKLERNWW